MTHPHPLEDTRTPAQLTADCTAAPLTAPERLEALRNITLRRDTLTREMAQLDAIESGHRAALEGGRA